MTLGTRAVIRLVEPGAIDFCPYCGEHIRFRGKVKPLRRVLANIYVGDRWDRLEVSHEPCYLAAGEPYGQATA